jgi:dipeptidyl aminopeptidase/acylaminoacyl peptidase
MKGLPWERAEAFQKASPTYRMNRVTTPTLIHCGENDERVPVQHSRTLFRALHDYLKVPTQLLVYKGAGHGLTKMSHRRAKMEWDLAWFERYVQTREPTEPASSAPSSPPSR